MSLTNAPTYLSAGTPQQATGAMLLDTNGNPISGTNGLATNDQSYATVAPAYYQVNVGAGAQTLAALMGTAVPAWATMAFVTPETGSLRYRADGTAPTSAIGQPVAQGQSWPLQGAATLAAAQFIAGAATTVSIEFRG